MRRAKRLGGGYQPIPAQPEENPEEGEIGQETEDTKEHSIIKRGENLPIIGLSEYNKNGKEAKNFRINHIVGNLTAHNKATEENKHKKNGIRISDGSYDAVFKDCNRSGSHSCPK